MPHLLLGLISVFSILLLAKHHCGTGREIKLEPSLAVALKELVEVGEMSHRVISEAIASIGRCICIEHNFVGTLWHHEAIAFIGACGGEIENEEEIATAIGEDLIRIIVPYFLNGELADVSNRLEEMNHIMIEIAKIMVAEVVVVDEVPLATGILVTPVVAFAGEVNPFGMTKLVAHEVEIAAVNCGGCDESNHLVESDPTMDCSILIAFAEVPVHVCVDESENEGLVTHKCLVVALTIRDGSFVSAAIGHFPENR